MRYSSDMIHWEAGPSALAAAPAWAHQIVQGARGEWTWAPDVIFLNGQYYLYYSFSTFGRKISVIGLATSPTLDPSSPKYRWTDQGEVVGSGDANQFNAIDPCPVLDAKGDLWMTFGSWWSGIQLVRLDNKTGKAISPPQNIASGKDRLGPEASFIYYHRDYYYLWDNEGWCCRGMNSTYHMMIGRSKAITGPYVDKAGVPLMATGGSLFLRTDGIKFGPGCIGISHLNGGDICSFHYYDGLLNGRPSMAIEKLAWGKDGWPYVASDRPAGSNSPLSEGGRFALIAKGSKSALAVHAPDDREAATIGQANFDGGPLQEWNVSPTGDGSFSISSLADGLFVDAPGGAGVDQARWGAADGLKWSIEPAGDSAYKIVSKATGQALTAANSPTGVASTSPSGEGSGQEWVLKRLP